jgi:hypothetical protein
VKCDPEPATKIVEIDGGGGGDKKQEDGPIDFNRLIIKKL